jgi:competence protein ComEC
MKHRLWLCFYGFNISIISLLFIHFFERILERYIGALATVFGIIFYTPLVGANAAVVRAAVLGLFAVFGRLRGRRQTGVNSLAIIAAGMGFFTPTVLWDVSSSCLCCHSWHHALC